MASTPVTLDIRVDPSQWVGLFDHIEVWRAILTPEGPFEELTAVTYEPARVPASAPDPPFPAQTGPLVNASGLSLQLLLDEKTPFSLVFTGSNPFHLGACATQINAATSGLLQAYVAGNLLVLQTVETGGRAAVRVVGGDAAPLFNLPTQEPLSLGQGREARVSLQDGVTVYPFTDVNGDPSYIYKTRFRNEATGDVSEFSAPPPFTSGVDVSNVIRGYVRLVDLSGRPLASYNVSVHNDFAGINLGDVVVAGGDEDTVTDNHGQASFLLVRGVTVTVSVAGTNIARKLVVPTDPAVLSFNLLSPDIGTQTDLFKVQVPDLAFAERRSL